MARLKPIHGLILYLYTKVFHLKFSKFYGHFFNWFIILSLSLISVKTIAQSSIIAGSADETTLRDLQLLGQFNKNYSFTTRPVFLKPSDTIHKYLFNNHKSLLRDNKLFSIYTSPLVWHQQYNSNSPWGRNNTPMLLVKGYQQAISAGISLASKYLEIQIMPNFFLANNTPFIKDNYTKLSWGQSAIRLRLGTTPISLSLSTESLWWGPGIFNSLMMSNNAPGFEHLSIHTNRPWKTPIGIFEFQVVGGNLTNIANLPSENHFLINANQVANINNIRYFNGINFSYQPRFLKGLSIGLNRIFQYDISNRPFQGNTLETYAPVFSGLFKSTTGAGNGLAEDAKNRDQLVNLFARFHFENVQTEIYGEYGWNDHSYNIRDFVLNPDHSSVYLLGIRKMIPLDRYKHIGVEAELTQLEPTNSDLARGAGNWYTHVEGAIEGYTNQDQIIGGGVTPGDNTATLRVSLVNKLIKQSITLERYQHDPRFHPIQWTDWSLAFLHQQPITPKIYVVGGLDFVRRLNYLWKTENAFNTQFSLKALYHW